MTDIETLLEHGHFEYGAYDMSKMDDEYVLLEDMHCYDWREVASEKTLDALLTHITSNFAEWRYVSGAWEKVA